MSEIQRTVYFNAKNRTKYSDKINLDIFNSAAEYQITVSIKDCSNCGTTGSQYVKITGTQGETTEQRCEANFNLIGKDVTCTVNSGENIGDYRCLIWRNDASDGWDITRVI